MAIFLNSDQQYNALKTDWLRLKSYWDANQIIKYSRNRSELHKLDLDECIRVAVFDQPSKSDLFGLAIGSWTPKMELPTKRAVGPSEGVLC